MHALTPELLDKNIVRCCLYLMIIFVFYHQLRGKHLKKYLKFRHELGQGAEAWSKKTIKRRQESSATDNCRTGTHYAILSIADAET